MNNLRSNPRLADSGQNSWNRSPSGMHKGVELLKGKRSKPFAARIQCRGTRIRIGVYENADEACWAYDQFAIALFGDFAVTNFEYSILTNAVEWKAPIPFFDKGSHV